MLEFPAYFIPLVALLAYFIKGATGFGPALIIVSIGSLLIGPKNAIVLSSILDIVAGAYLVYLDPLKNASRFWLPMAIAIVLGAVTGGIILSIIPEQNFDRIIGIFIFAIGLWFVLGRDKSGSNLMEKPPDTWSFLDVSITYVAGIGGGLFGISGPLLIFYLGRKFAKHIFRRTLVLIFLASALAKNVTYASTGLLTMEIGWLGLLTIPFVFIGIYLGNHAFFRMSEQIFGRVVGVLLIVISVRLML